MSRIFLHLLSALILCIFSPSIVSAELPSPYAPWPTTSTPKANDKKPQNTNPSKRSHGATLPSAQTSSKKSNDLYGLYEEQQKESPPSALERLYADRLIDEPKQFGYEIPRYGRFILYNTNGSRTGRLHLGHW